MTDTTQGGDETNVWTRLRRRKVVQWGVAYVAGAWGFLQGLEYVGEAFHWPDHVRQIALLTLVVALPIVLVLAWYHGDRGEQRIKGTEFAIITLLFLLGGGLFWYYQRATESTNTAAALSPPAAALATDRSIAVLPFVNLSPDKEQEYFADGISEELLNLLAQVPGMRVIARTSSFSFKGKDVDIAEIAHALNVANVLEGSVRKSGDKLRITAQLIRASDSSHLWAQTYDRQITDVFKVQDEIAAAVVGQLKLTLLGQAPTADEVNPQAFALFLQGRHVRRRHTPEAYVEAIKLFEQALMLAPTYSAPWDQLASVYINQMTAGLRPLDEGVRLAREAVASALAINPDDAAAHSVLGWLAMVYDGDFAAAARHYEHALAIDPTNTDIIGNAASLATSLGRLDLAMALNEYANARDPIDPVGAANLGGVYLGAGRLEEAVASYRTALLLAPGYVTAHYGIGVALLRKGETQAALTEMEKEGDAIARLVGLTMVYHTLGRKPDSDAALAELTTKYAHEAAYNIAYALAWRNEGDRAFKWLDKSVALEDPGLTEIVFQPLFANLEHDPRWTPFLRKIGKAPEQLAAIKFDVKVPQ